MTSSTIRRALLASAAVLASAGAAFAQTQTAANTTGAIETVVVTAQYKAQNIQSTPLAITAVTAEDLEKHGYTNLSQLSATVPSLTLNPTPAAFGNGLQAFIRGVGAFDTAFEHEPGVGMYVDDLYFGTLAGSELELMDLSRVEVLRGPQGVLGGKNDIGGAIKLFTQTPSDDNSGYFQAAYGSYNEINVKGAFNATIVPEHLFVRVSGMSKNQDGYVNVIDYACAFGSGTGPTGGGSLPVLTNNKNCKLGTQGGTNVNGARLATRLVVNSKIEDTLAFDVVRDNSEVAPDILYAVYNTPGGSVYYNNGGGLKTATPTDFFGSAAAAAAANPAFPTTAWNFAHNLPTYGILWDQRFIPADPYKTTYATYRSQNGNTYTDGDMFHSWSASNVFDADIFDWLHFKSITGYRHYNSAYSDDSDVSPMAFQLTTTYNDNSEYQQEERFNGTLFDNRLEWSAGAFYYRRDSRSTGPVILDAFYDFGIPLVFEQNDLYKTRNNSGYVHGIYHVTDDLEVFAGFRYTSETKTYNFNHLGAVPGYSPSGFFRDTQIAADNPNNPADVACNFAILPQCGPNAALVNHTTRTERPDYRAGIDYHVTDDIMAYFQFATGYRTGGTNSRPFSTLQLNSYGPESIKSYELGAKTDWFDHRLRANIAIYDAEYSNTIVPIATVDSGGAPFVENVNLGSSTNRGVELEFTAAPVDNVLLNANYSYIDSKVNPAPGAPPGFVDPLGTIPVGSPPALFPKQQFNLGGQYTFHLGAAGGDLTPRLDYNWQDITYQAALGSKFLAVPSHGVLNGRLAWDAPTGGWQVALAVTNLSDERYFYDMFNLAAFGFGTVTANPAPPREWMFTVRKAF